MKRKLIGSVLLTLWLLQCTCSFIVYKVEREQCYRDFLKQYENRLSLKEVQTFTFDSKQKINWEREQEELEIGGALYDVISVRQEAHRTIFTCISDKNEDRVVASYKSLSSEKSKPSPENKQFKKLLDLKCVLERISGISNPFFFEQRHVLCRCNSVVSKFLKIDSPPPKC